MCSGTDGLGRWHSKTRDLWADYPRAIPGERPKKVVKVWLIANSIFARNRAAANFRRISEG